MPMYEYFANPNFRLAAEASSGSITGGLYVTAVYTDAVGELLTCYRIAR